MSAPPEVAGRLSLLSSPMFSLLPAPEEGVPDRLAGLLAPRPALEGVLTFKGEAAGVVLHDPAVPGRLLLRRPSESVKVDASSLEGGGFGRVFNCAHIGM